MSGLSVAHADDDDDFKSLLDNAVACAITEEALADMSVEPLYHADQSVCQLGDPSKEKALQWFGDASCTVPVNFRPTKMRDFCEDALDKATLGNAVNIDPTAWTLYPGNRLDVGAKPLDGVTQPYMQRRIYKTISNERGQCQLEMRIYSKSPIATGQRAMVAYHGGSWTSRGFGYFGLELTVPHYIEQGFVVFAPFYRLLDDRESTAACNQASLGQIEEDANSALDWVLENASEYGATGAPVVFGQSAGGHLAAAVSVDRTEAISSAVLMYPPADFSDFLLRAQEGYYDNDQGLSILERVIGSAANDASIDDTLIYRNSFPLRIQNDNATAAPMMIVQGMEDELVESRQSYRLCQALAGEPLLPTSEEITPVEELVYQRDCGTQASLHLVREGDHALDVCLYDKISLACPSGSKQSRQAVAQIISDAAQFAAASVRERSDDDARPGAGGSAGVLALAFLFPLLMLLLARRFWFKATR